MKFAFLSLDFRRFSLPFAFECAARYGFDGVEIWGGRPHAYAPDVDGEKIAEIKALQKKYGLEVPMFCPDALNQNKRLTVPDSREREDALSFLKKNIDVAARLEIPRMLVLADHPGYDVDYDTVWKVFCENIRELADYARGTGVRLTVEPLTAQESPIITRADDCVRLIKDVDRDNVHFMMDIVPPLNGYEPYSSYFTKLGDRMDYIHICNNDGVTDAHTRLENGVIPIEDMFTVLKNWGYDDYVSAELYSEIYHDPELMLANTARVLAGIRERAGI